MSQAGRESSSADLRPEAGSARAGSSGATRWVPAILAVSFVVSVVHYADNTVRFDRYALNPDSPVANAPWSVPLAWVVLTAVGLVGLLAYRAGNWWRAVGAFAVYSVSGLVSAVHYTDAPPSAFDGLQNTLIVADLVAGVAVVGLALWVMFRRALVADAQAGAARLRG
ncbi:hypothetical protein SAMN05421678_112172 [Actinopolymorpha cephalotaxi]|uniref:Uncharacterized protein n=1 Tax=Actinopolymorpha cephalotaxi TaxID=504797 RepID=A0A1I2XFZ4_9ACTN|nr:hypothetical protein [Actinopolymorpha cephalotaxi]NYH86237.1 hypothetical protein [Actinopolymorpha cephalotaxi]SFH12355.1 hypothetical protein SAMN05421678_112172 [Actinopolymorpha cephalotaxi]